MADRKPQEAQPNSAPTEGKAKIEKSVSPEILAKRMADARTYMLSIVADLEWERKKKAKVPIAPRKDGTVPKKTEAELRYEKTFRDDELWEKVWNGRY